MAFEQRLVQKLSQQLVMTPQLQQAIKLLQLSRIELEEMVVKELQENPALEEGAGEEADNSEQPRAEAQSAAADGLGDVVANRELSTVDKMVTTPDWQEYLDMHSNSMHSSLTAEAMS
ncbi:MAG TPA: RNA polymerase sigma-54 factor, partial [Candidatus Binatia bacterium]